MINVKRKIVNFIEDDNEIIWENDDDDPSN